MADNVLLTAVNVLLLVDLGNVLLRTVNMNNPVGVVDGGAVTGDKVITIVCGDNVEIPLIGNVNTLFKYVAEAEFIPTVLLIVVDARLMLTSVGNSIVK